MPLGQSPHNPLENLKGITLAHPPEVLAALVAESVKNQCCQLVHALCVAFHGILFQIHKNYSGKTIQIIQSLSPFVTEGNLPIF